MQHKRNRKSGNENENRSQQNEEYFQPHLAVTICFFMSCVLTSDSIQKHPDKSEKAPVLFLRSYLSRTGPRSVLDKYELKKSVMFIRNFQYLKIQRCVIDLVACQFRESQSRSFKTFWVLAEGLCVRPEGKKTLPQSLQGEMTTEFPLKSTHQSEMFETRATRTIF